MAWAMQRSAVRVENSRIDESRLRHPFERRIFVASAVLSALMAAAAVVAVLLGAEWLKDHPVLEAHKSTLRLAALAAVGALPAAHLLRRVRSVLYLGNSVRMSAEQFPRVHAVLESHCARLGMAKEPALYLCRGLTRGPARAFSGLDRDLVVLGTTLFEIPGGPGDDVIGFALGRALGSIRLGHTRWWDEALLFFVMRVPGLRNPVRAARAYSCDRYGAALTPDGIRGLILEASGPDALPDVNVAAYRRQAAAFSPGVLEPLLRFLQDPPHVCARLQALREAGLWRADDAAAPRAAAASTPRVA